MERIFRGRSIKVVLPRVDYTRGLEQKDWVMELLLLAAWCTLRPRGWGLSNIFKVGIGSRRGFEWVVAQRHTATHKQLRAISASGVS